MIDEQRTKTDLIEELAVLRRRNGELETQLAQERRDLEGVRREVAERGRGEEALRESEIRYRRLFEDCPISLWEQDLSEIKLFIDALRESGVDDVRTYFRKHGGELVKYASLVRTVEVNRSTLRLFESETKEEFLGGTSRFFTEESYEAFGEALAAFADGSLVYEGEQVNQTLKGNRIRLALRASVYPDALDTWKKVLLSFIDITEQKEAEDALRESEQRLRHVLDHSRDMAYSFNLEKGSIEFVGAAAVQLFGYTADDLMAMGIAEANGRVHPEDWARLEEELNDLIERAPEHGSMVSEYRWKHKNGDYRWCSDNRSLVLGDDGQPTHVVGVIRDITNRKLAEEALRETQQRLHAVIEAVPLILWAVDTEGRITVSQGRALRALGVEDNEYVGRSVYEVYKNYPGNLAMIWRGLTGETSSKDTETGDRFWDNRCVPQFDENGEVVGLLGVSVDITDRKRAEEALAQVGVDERQRIRRDLHDSVGQDLTGLSSMARSLSRKLHGRALPEAEAADAIVRGIQQTLDDVQGAIKGLGPVEMDPLGLMVALEQLVETAQAQYDADVRYECVGAVGVEDNNSAMHLFRIAQEAINNAAKHARARHIVVSLSGGDGRVCLEIHDDGVGIGNDVEGSSGMGLRIMRYRANTVGADFRIEALAEGGTRVMCTCPQEKPVQGIGEDDGE